MRYEDIKDFEQRCEEHPDHQSGMISESMIQARLSEEIDELRAYIESKQEQGEPVAWRNAAIRVGEDLCSIGPFGYYDMTAEQWLGWALSVVTVHLPPQQRKPLTDEQADSIINGLRTCLHRDSMRQFLKVWLRDWAAHGAKDKA